MDSFILSSWARCDTWIAEMMSRQALKMRDCPSPSTAYDIRCLHKTWPNCPKNGSLLLLPEVFRLLQCLVQARGITMKSSSIALIHRAKKQKVSENGHAAAGRSPDVSSSHIRCCQSISIHIGVDAPCSKFSPSSQPAHEKLEVT